MQELELFQDESVDGDWGGMASRKEENRTQWLCMDSDYMWMGVVNDFGHIVPVSEFINMRGF